MKKTASLLKLISYIYWACTGAVVCLYLIELVVLAILYFICIYTHNSFGDSLATLQQKYNLKNSFGLNSLFNAVLLCSNVWLNAIVFASLAKFLNAESNKENYATQKTTLTKLPRYLVALYVLETIQIFIHSDQFKTETSDNNPLVALMIDHLIPNLGSPLGLILAGAIYFYGKKLEEEEALKKENSRLKEEAELVI